MKWILQYLRGMLNLRLALGCEKPEVVGYKDLDLAGDLDSQKSTSGYMVFYAG